MRQPSRLLGGVVKTPPLLTLFRQEQATDQCFNFRVTGRYLLEVWVGRGETASDRASVITSKRIKVAMNAAIMRMFQYRFHERCVRFIEFAKSDDLRSHWMRVVRQKLLFDCSVIINTEVNGKDLE